MSFLVCRSQSVRPWKPDMKCDPNLRQKHCEPEPSHLTAQKVPGSSTRADKKSESKCFRFVSAFVVCSKLAQDCHEPDEDGHDERQRKCERKILNLHFTSKLAEAVGNEGADNLVKTRGICNRINSILVPGRRKK
jgi:hypothetical protein